MSGFGALMGGFFFAKPSSGIRPAGVSHTVLSRQIGSVNGPSIAAAGPPPWMMLCAIVARVAPSPLSRAVMKMLRRLFTSTFDVM